MTTIRLDVFHHVVLADSGNPLIKLILEKVNTMATTVTDLVTKVAALKTVEDSVVTLLGDLKTRLDAAIAGGSDPAALQALSDDIGAQTQRLADAVVQNTPAA
jgi:hypothetical protein